MKRNCLDPETVKVEIPPLLPAQADGVNGRFSVAEIDQLWAIPFVPLPFSAEAAAEICDWFNGS